MPQSGRRRESPPKLSPDFHTCAIACMQACTHTDISHTHTYKYAHTTIINTWRRRKRRKRRQGMRNSSLGPGGLLWVPRLTQKSRKRQKQRHTMGKGRDRMSDSEHWQSLCACSGLAESTQADPSGSLAAGAWERPSSSWNSRPA